MSPNLELYLISSRPNEAPEKAKFKQRFLLIALSLIYYLLTMYSTSKLRNPKKS